MAPPGTPSPRAAWSWLAGDASLSTSSMTRRTLVWGPRRTVRPRHHRGNASEGKGEEADSGEASERRSWPVRRAGTSN